MIFSDTKQRCPLGNGATNVVHFTFINDLEMGAGGVKFSKVLMTQRLKEGTL